eukprot:CAMPEP_0176289060 /NCGR_PEP_ID=MMETSP0121_2-20121125/54299_1 /TAXON_ID=160619 /ORGANISM="Kryptoperidinium foliaceum, Strain CCMP 1326" /LENGTH=109 /DNA_ID=CAMNT_0017629781 /DNA_START=133 /DNA_END=459 /DNA_ORIENTATION=+
MGDGRVVLWGRGYDENEDISKQCTPVLERTHAQVQVCRCRMLRPVSLYLLQYVRETYLYVELYRKRTGERVLPGTVPGVQYIQPTLHTTSTHEATDLPVKKGESEQSYL